MRAIKYLYCGFFLAFPRILRDFWRWEANFPLRIQTDETESLFAYQPLISAIVIDIQYSLLRWPDQGPMLAAGNHFVCGSKIQLDSFDSRVGGKQWFV